MLYAAYQAHADAVHSLREFTVWATSALRRLKSDLPTPARRLAIAYELLMRVGLTHERPAFGIESIRVGNSTVAVREESICTMPFANLIRFVKGVDAAQPRVLVVAPLSGHFATLLRDTVSTLLVDHDVYVTDWRNARDVPTAAGGFGFDDYVDYLLFFLQRLGPGTHVLAVCQPCVQALVAVALLAESHHPGLPSSMTLMAGPIDTRISPTKVNRLATSQPIEWFESQLIATVPKRFGGAHRAVYPGFIQLAAFTSLNIERHLRMHLELYQCVVDGAHERAKTIRAFYDEYFAVLDLTAEFYLQTVQYIFQENRLAAGKLKWRGVPVDLRAIRRTALLTVEGERDDICAVGQTLAAHELLTGLKPYLKRHHLQAGAGHYGVFAGNRWATQVYPHVRNTILASE